MKFRKKPVVIDAIQWTGKNASEVLAFCEHKAMWHYASLPDKINIETLEGNMKADLNDWIIKGVKGEFYPCKPDIFEKTYEPADQPKSCEGCKHLDSPTSPLLETCGKCINKSNYQARVK